MDGNRYFLGIEDLGAEVTYESLVMFSCMGGLMRMHLQHVNFMNSSVLRTQRNDLDLRGLGTPLVGLPWADLRWSGH